MRESINDTKTDYTSVEDPINMHRTASNKATPVSDIPDIIHGENVANVPV